MRLRHMLATAAGLLVAVPALAQQPAPPRPVDPAAPRPVQRAERALDRAEDRIERAQDRAAQRQTALRPVQPTMNANADQMIARCMIFGNNAEVELGKLAVQHAQSQQTKEFAQHMIEDHTRCSQELTEIAKKNNFKLATELTKECKDIIAKLSNAKGAEFDRQYMDTQVKVHQEAVTLFKTQAKSGQNADLRAFADKGLPGIEKHLQKAQQIAKEVSK